MYKYNDQIQCDGRVGRVFSIGERKTIHVLVRMNDYTWKVEKWFEPMCRPYIGFMWTIEQAMNIRYGKKLSYGPMEIEEVVDDYAMDIDL